MTDPNSPADPTSPADLNSPAPSSPPAPRISVGAHVTSRFAPEWGKGIVMGVDGKHVRVLFVAHPSRKQVVVPAASLAIEHLCTWPDPSKAAAASTPAPKSSKSAAKKKKLVDAPAAAPAAEPTPEEGSSSS